MELNGDGGSRGRIARLLLAAVLAAVAVRSFRAGKRTSGALAAIGAVVLGRDAAAELRELSERDQKRIDVGGDEDVGEDADVGSASGGADDDAALHCAICGEPIVPGQARGPGPNDEIVHDACEEALA